MRKSGTTKTENQNIRANLFLENAFEEGLNINRPEEGEFVNKGVEEEEWRQYEEVDEDRGRDEEFIGRDRKHKKNTKEDLK